jgi:hypothetical protein
MAAAEDAEDAATTAPDAREALPPLPPALAAVVDSPPRSTTTPRSPPWVASKRSRRNRFVVLDYARRRVQNAMEMCVLRRRRCGTQYRKRRGVAATLLSSLT